MRWMNIQWGLKYSDLKWTLYSALRRT
jgi:hypothetical protein